MRKFRRFSLALAIFALAILALAIGLPTQKAELPMQTPTALAIPTQTKTPQPTPTRKAENATVQALKSLNVRVRPGEQSAVSGALYNGDTVTLTGICLTGWAQIIWKDATAWVNAKFLSDNKCLTKP